MKNDRFLKSSFLIYIIAAGFLSYEVLMGEFWIKLTTDTGKMIVSTIMGVSGSIIGFLVIYLSMSFEAIRRNYGKHALRIFRNDIYIWSLCLFFCTVIAFGLIALLWSDKYEIEWNWAFNMSCLSFGFGVVLIVPFGYVILGKSGSNLLVERMIDSLDESDFNKPPFVPSIPSEIFWIIQESNKNKVDVITNILFHHIVEGDYNIGSQILLNVFRRISELSKIKGVDTDKMLFRYLDTLQTAFDISMAKNDQFTVKIILYGFNSCSKLIAEYRLESRIIEKMFDSINYISKSLIESEKEELLSETLWTYYHMSEAQITNNLPRDNEMWTTDEEGNLNDINTAEARNKELKFEAIDKAMTYDLSELVERTFLCRNYYITDNSVRMLTCFIEMLIFSGKMDENQKWRTGSSLCCSAEQYIRKFFLSNPKRQLGYLSLYLGEPTLLTALKENSRFSEVAFSTYVTIYDYLLEQGGIQKFDVENIGGLTRLLIASSSSIFKANDYLKDLLELQQRVRIHFMKEVKDSIPKEGHIQELKGMISKLQNDLQSYRSFLRNAVGQNDQLERLIDSYQI